MRDAVPVVVAFLVLGTACRDDGAAVRNGSGTGSASSATEADGTAPLGGYRPVSDIGDVARISDDACDIAGLLPPGARPDFDRAAALYAHGEHAAAAGVTLTLEGFAAAPPQRALKRRYADHFADPAWLDTFVDGAFAGRGPFAGHPDVVRRQAVLVAVEDAIPVAWALDELDAAVEQAGTEPPAEAPHSVDRAWGLYHGRNRTCAPFSTVAGAGRASGTGNTVADGIRAQMRRAQGAAGRGSAVRLRQAAAEVRRLLTIAHVQAVAGAAAAMDRAIAAGDQSTARVRQAEGWGRFRVVEPLVAEADAATAAAVAGLLDLRSPPSPGTGARVREALERAYPKLGISKVEVGTPVDERSTP